MRDLRRQQQSISAAENQALADEALSEALALVGSSNERTASDRSRRVRDAVEAALSDIILLGTEDQVRLAANAASELVAGRPIHTAELVVSLRDFIRVMLDLEPVPTQLSIPKQGPVRPSSAGGNKSAKGEGRQGAGKGGGGGGGDGGLYSDNNQGPHH